MALYPQIQALISNDRPLRWGSGLTISPKPRLEAIVTSGLRASLIRHVAFTRSVLSILPGPSLDTVMANERKDLWTDVTKDLQLGEAVCGCSIHRREIVLKEFTDGEIMANEIELYHHLTPDQITELNRAADEFVRDMVGGEDTADRSAIYDAMIAAVVIEALRLALAQMQSAVAAMSRRAQRAISRTAYPLNGREDFIANIYREGYTLVRAKITRFFLPTLREIINTELRAGKSWADVAYAINRKVGVGASWHWKRLVRTEMARAITDVTTAQWATYGVKYMGLSISMRKRESGEICGERRKEDVGYGPGIWLFANAPRPPLHPNCACTLRPIFRLPGEE